MKKVFRILRLALIVLATLGMTGALVGMFTTPESLMYTAMLAFWVATAALVGYFENRAAEEEKVKPLFGRKYVLYPYIALIVIALMGVYGATVDYREVYQQPEKTEVAVEATQAEVKKSNVTADGLFIAINKVRAKNNLPQFARNTDLDKSSMLKCRDMLDNRYFAHDNPATNMPGYDYVDDVGVYYRTVSENIATGVFMSATDVVNGWMDSESHAASILDPQFEQIGFAVCGNPESPDRSFVVQHKIAL